MSVRPSLIVANWKLNGDLALIERMSLALNSIAVGPVEVVICPPLPFLSAACAKKKRFSLGAQNMSQHSEGPYTGEVSAAMLRVFDVKYVILGHSERRAIFNESSDMIADKCATAIEQGLTPILCIGETEEQRNQGQTETVLSVQLKAVLDLVGIEAFTQIVIAYEPVWAIGTGKTATAEMAQETHSFIRQLLASYDPKVAQTVPLLYGGSVNSSNSKTLFAQADIDGGLVGGASLAVEEFLAICQSV